MQVAKLPALVLVLVATAFAAGAPLRAAPSSAVNVLTWASRAPMPVPRLTHAVALNDRIYAVGGFNDADGHVAVMHEYDPASNTWSQKASMSVGRYVPSVPLNGKLYAVGGQL